MGKVVPYLISFKYIFYLKFFYQYKTSFWSNQILFSLKIRFKSEIGAIQLSRAHFLLPSGRPTNKRPAPIDLPCTTGHRPSSCPPLPRLCRPSHQSDPPPFFLLRGRPEPPSLHLFFPCFVKKPLSAPLASYPRRASRPILSAPPPHPYLALPFPCTGGCLPSLDCTGSPPLSPALVATTFTRTLSSLLISSHGSPPPSRGAAGAARGRRWPLWELISGRKHPRRQTPSPPHRPAPSVSARPILLAWLPTHTTMVLVVKT
jgi:hypothetical protein